MLRLPLLIITILITLEEAAIIVLAIIQGITLDLVTVVAATLVHSLDLLEAVAVLALHQVAVEDVNNNKIAINDTFFEKKTPMKLRRYYMIFKKQ